MPYCPNCGAENEADAAYCESCGTRLATQVPPSPPVAAARGFPWAILGGIIVLVVLVVSGVVAYNGLTGDEEGPERRSGGDKQTAVLAEPTSTVTATPEVTPTVEPSPTEKPPATEPSLMGYDLPEQAIAVYLEQYELEYVGDCQQADIETDVGSYCSLLWEDRGDTLVYATGLTFSEPDTWLLLARQEGGGWLVVDSAEFLPPPEEPVPPWP